MKQRCVMVGGAEIGNYHPLWEHLNPDDISIFCDSGLFHQEALGIELYLIVGDIDSCPYPHLDVETITLPCEGVDDFLHLGVTVGQLDHTLSNISSRCKVMGV